MAEKETYEEMEQRIETLAAERAEANELLRKERGARKHAEDRLERIESIINRGAAVLFLWGIEPGVWPVKHVSKNIEKILGYSVDDFLSGLISWPGITHPDDVPRLEAENARYFSEGVKEWSQEYRLLTKSGDIRWMKDWNRVLVDPAGESTGLQAIAIDITERKQAEEKLRESNEILRRSHLNLKSLLENTDDFILIGDEKGSPVLFNASYARIMKEALGIQMRAGLKPHKMLPDKAMVAFWDGLHRRVLSGEKFRTEYSQEFPNGDIRHFETSFTPIIENGQTKGFSEVTRDITEKKQAEEAIIKSEEKFRSLAESSPNSIMRYDRQCRHIYVNPACARVAGIPADEFIGKTHREMDFDEQLCDIWEEKILEVFETREQRQWEFKFKGDKGWMFLDWRVVPEYTEDGQVKTVVGVCNDTTAAKQVEQALRETRDYLDKLIQCASAPIIVWAPDLGISRFNRAFEYLSGYAADEVIGRELSMLFPEESRAKSLREIEHTSSGESWESVEIPILHRNGDVRLVLWNSASIYAEDGTTLLTTIAQGVDITERKLAQEEKEQLQTQLRHAQKMEAISTLAGGIAHDFNNILTAILGYGQLAQMKLDPKSEVYRDLKEVLESGNRAKLLIQQILAVGRSQEQERQPMQLKHIVREALKFLKSTLPSTIEIRETYDEDVGVIDADPTQMHQVLMNLCTNAGHAMEKNGGILTVSLRNVAVVRGKLESGVHLEPGPYLRLSVSDTGYGIAPEIREKIFDPYFTTKEPGLGTGIGLSVVHGIVAQHGGDITVESEPGKRSTFHVYFPLAQAEEQKPAVEEDTPLPKGRERILFIDDEAVLAKMGKKMLESLGYDVTAMTSSLEALALFKEDPKQFDLVITDTTMPHMPGDILAQKIMEIRPDIPVIICTGHSKRISKEKAEEMGIKGFLMKPPAMRDVGNMVRKVLDEK